MKTLVISHSADFDGLFSAAVCSKFLPDADQVGWDYGDPCPQTEGYDEIYLVDISIDELMNDPRLVYIDHHISAINKYPKSIPGYCIDGVAACRLCYQWFTYKGSDEIPLPDKDMFVERTVQEPLAIRLAGEYDIWDKRDPKAELFQFGLVGNGIDTYEKCELVMNFKDETVLKIVSDGQAVFNWQQNFASDVLKNRSYIREFEGVKFCILASAHCRNSMWFPEDCIQSEAEALMCWRYDGEKVSISMYHKPGREDIDLSIIAVKYGGGGHRGACGFGIENKVDYHPLWKLEEMGIV